MFSYLYSIATQIESHSLPRLTGEPSTIQNILSIAFGIIGAVALLIITISGLRYITSAGDPQKASTAKSGIVYALVGLVIAISAQAIVVFVTRGMQ